MRMTIDAVPREWFGGARVARLATVSAAGEPHLVPVTFAVIDACRHARSRRCGTAVADLVVFAVDHKPKSTTALRRLDNIAANPRVAFLVDHYDDDWDELWWVRADATAAVLDGPDRLRAIAALQAKYPQYQRFRRMAWWSVLRFTAGPGGGQRASRRSPKWVPIAPRVAVRPHAGTGCRSPDTARRRRPSEMTEPSPTGPAGRGPPPAAPTRRAPTRHAGAEHSRHRHAGPHVAEPTRAGEPTPLPSDRSPSRSRPSHHRRIKPSRGTSTAADPCRPPTAGCAGGGARSPRAP